MEQPENKEEVIKGDIDLQSLHLGKTVHRRCAELVKTADGKNDGNTANKKGNTKNRKSAVEQSAMVRKNNATNNKSVQSWYLLSAYSFGQDSCKCSSLPLSFLEH